MRINRKDRKQRSQSLDRDRELALRKRNRVVAGQAEIPSDDSYVVRQSPASLKAREMAERGAQGINTARQSETRKLREPKGASVRPV